MKKDTGRQIGIFIFCALLTFSAGFIGSIFTFSAISTWYTLLDKPAFNPPNWVFGPAWSFLYFLMAVSLYLVLKKGVNSKLEIQVVRLFLLQLVLNTLWSILFFGFKLPLFALFEIIVLWIVILVLILRLYKINKTSSLLLVPYILWVSFASFLNYWIVLLN